MNSKENMKKYLAAQSNRKTMQAKQVNKFEYKQVSTVSWLSKEKQKLNTGNIKPKAKTQR